jgi:hypothetical protein
MPGFKRRGGATPLPNDANKKPKLQENRIEKIKIAGQKIAIMSVDDEATRSAMIKSAENFAKHHKKATRPVTYSVTKDEAVRTLFSKEMTMEEVLGFLDKKIEYFIKELENFSAMIKSKLEDLDAALSKTRSGFIYNAEASFSYYLQKAYDANQFVQQKSKKLLKEFFNLNSTLGYFLKKYSNNEKLLKVKQYFGDIETILDLQLKQNKNVVVDCVESKLDSRDANFFNTLPLEAAVKSWLTAIIHGKMVADIKVTPAWESESTKIPCR